MPPSGYLTASSIETCLQYLATTYPSICQLIVLPEASREGRTIRALKIANGGSADRDAVLLIGGVHARELVNPDLLLTFSLRLCHAYTVGSGLDFGPKSYTSSTVKLLVDALDIFVLPLVNPDGREHVQAPTGYAMWRKNRSPNGGGAACVGVDLNRNYDFLFASGIGTSTNTCSDVFRGPSAFSEPETRNVRYLLDTYANIHCLADVHSYGELILHPWGDDDTQTVDPAQHFQNPAFNGLRGGTGDVVYREFMVSADLAKHTQIGNRVRDGIAAVRGHAFTVEPAVNLYPTSGTSKDYAYGRHLVDAGKRKVFAYTFETALEFQPPYSEALNVISEVGAGLVEFCLACLCTVEDVLVDFADRGPVLDELRAFRDFVLQPSPVGRRWIELLERHSSELLQIAQDEPALRKRAQAAVAEVAGLLGVHAGQGKKPFRLPARTVRGLGALADALEGRASPALVETIGALRGDLRALASRPLEAVLAPPTRAERSRRGKRARV